MPYSTPSSGVVAPPPPPSPMHTGRPGHRRSYTFAADDPTSRAGGAFASLGALPRRTRSQAPTSPPPRRGPQFHFRGDEDAESSESSEEPPLQGDEDDGPPPPLRLRQQPTPALAFRLTPPTARFRPATSSPQRSPNASAVSINTAPTSLTPNAVPFPRTSPSSPLPASPLPAASRPPGPARTASHPVILLSNGKPLKSSLKSSSSAPHMHPHPTHHLRARSAPSTPSLSLSSADDDEGWEAESPGTPKNVRFPEQDKGLETVLLFKRGARPASVARPLDEETETETETDSMPRWMSASAAYSGGAYPFPRVAPGGGKSPLNPRRDDAGWKYVLEAPGVPRRPEPGSMVLLEGLRLEVPPSAPSELTLSGTLLARNAAFEKHLFVRFTLDGWCTTSEVGARYVEATAFNSSSNSTSSDSNPTGEEPGPGWDRFAFSIRLTDYAHAGGYSSNGNDNSGGMGRGLEGRELVLVARFWAPWVGAGGVGPYVWCDTLAPLSGQHQQYQGAGTSARGRAWVGTGGGGPGEWWDNNAGRDYRVGFRVVQDPPPAPAPVQNAIPFPSVDAASASTSSPATLRLFVWARRRRPRPTRRGAGRRRARTRRRRRRRAKRRRRTGAGRCSRRRRRGSRARAGWGFIGRGGGGAWLRVRVRRRLRLPPPPLGRSRRLSLRLRL
ncbi:hypothetical protein B0H17DRAFT_392020 [Mycena rosella]|uniref:CBM21 domain-containing protein n=1 Tax=Mycena rosella TaxID=1033263 RepID=A0AAD7DQ81_MYCRO|nr:hypothetical protein B0H17DRAFT_392020 [Mycena rosella]